MGPFTVPLTGVIAVVFLAACVASTSGDDAPGEPSRSVAQGPIAEGDAAAPLSDDASVSAPTIEGQGTPNPTLPSRRPNMR